MVTHTRVPILHPRDTSKVTNLEGFMHHSTSFNQDISRWVVSNVASMHAIFGYASAFNFDIAEWRELVTTQTMFAKQYGIRFARPSVRPSVFYLSSLCAPHHPLGMYPTCSTWKGLSATLVALIRTFPNGETC